MTPKDFWKIFYNFGPLLLTLPFFLLGAWTFEFTVCFLLWSIASDSRFKEFRELNQ